jgi:hypothetical protein
MHVQTFSSLLENLSFDFKTVIYKRNSPLAINHGEQLETIFVLLGGVRRPFRGTMRAVVK